MKKHLLTMLASGIVILSLLSSCSKDSSTPAPPVTSLDGTWETTNWFDPNDIVRVTITNSTTGGTGVFSYLNAQAVSDGFTLGNMVYHKINTSGTGTYNVEYIYRFGPLNKQSGYANCVLTLQSNGTVLYAHASLDPLTGITPKDHYFQRK